MNKVVIDASVLLAYIRKEHSLEDLSSLFPHSFISAVNYAEVVTVLSGYGMPQEVIETTLKSMVHDVTDFNALQANLVGSLREQTKVKGLSLGDRACIALGIQMQLPIYTADKIWADISLEHADIRLIR